MARRACQLRPASRQLPCPELANDNVVFSREQRDRKQPRLWSDNAWLWVENSAWLLGLTNYDQRHETWRAVTWSVLVEPSSPPPAAAAAALQAIAERLI